MFLYSLHSVSLKNTAKYQKQSPEIKTDWNKSFYIHLPPLFLPKKENMNYFLQFDELQHHMWQCPLVWLIPVLSFSCQFWQWQHPQVEECGTCFHCRSPVHPSELSWKHTAFPWVRHTPASKASPCRRVMQVCCCWKLFRKKQVWVLAYHSYVPQAKKSRAGHLTYTAWICVMCWLSRMWMFGRTDGQEADSSILGGPRTSHHLDFRTFLRGEKVSVTVPPTGTSPYQQCPPSGGSPWLSWVLTRLFLTAKFC